MKYKKTTQPVENKREAAEGENLDLRNIATPAHDVPRNEKGQWIKGHTGNPTGENGMKGLPRYEIRIKRLLDNFTQGDLIALSEGKKVKGLDGNTYEMAKMSAYDAMLLVQLIGAVKGGRQAGFERERMLDRIQGRPGTTITDAAGKTIFNIVHGVPDNDELER